PKCKECGKEYQSSFDTGLCDICARTFASQAVKLPSAAIITKEGYQQAVERASANLPPPSEASQPAWLPLLLGGIFPLLWLAVVGWAYSLFGSSTHFTSWSLCSGFFLLGLAMTLAGRIPIRRTQASDRLEPTAAASVHLIVGLLWILPLLLYLF